MIETIDKKGFKKRVTVWFPDADYITKTKCDVCCYVGIEKLHNEKNTHVKFLSLKTDLTKPMDEIFDGFVKVNKYDIRRSERDSLDIYHLTSKDLSANKTWIDKFCSMYEEMYAKKGIENVHAPLSAMNRYIKDNILTMTVALSNGVPAVFHVYIVDGTNARLLMSCSSFRNNEDKQYRAMIGRANKRLHFEDMKSFSENGYKIYDWGGLSSFDNPNGIDIFKMSFGGKKIIYYDETVIKSFKYKVLRKLLKK